MTTLRVLPKPTPAIPDGLTYAQLARRLTVLRVPPEAWQAYRTMGQVQAVARTQYHLLARQYHPDAWRRGQRRLISVTLAAEVIENWMCGATLGDLAKTYGLAKQTISDILHERTGTRAPKYDALSPDSIFQKVTRAYQWIARWDKDAPVPTTQHEHERLEHEYRQLLNPLGGDYA